MAGDEDDGQFRIHGVHRGKQIQPAHARQANIADHHASEVGRQVFLRHLRTAHAAALIAFQLQGLFAGHGDVGVVFNNQNMELGIHGHRLFREAAEYPPREGLA